MKQPPVKWETDALAGIPRIRWEPGWVLLIVLSGVLLATSILPARIPGVGPLLLAATTAVTLGGLLLCFLIHELAHFVVAKSYGVDTRRITLTLFGGVPETNQPLPHPEAMFTVALAGPIANLALCVTAYLLVGLASAPLQVAIDITATVSLFLGLTNLVPAQPLDGGRMLHAAVWARTGNPSAAYRAEHRSGRLLGSSSVVAGITLMLLGGWTVGLFAISLGLLLRSAASARWIYAASEVELAGKAVRDYAQQPEAALPRSLSVESVVEDAGGLKSRGRIPVVDGERLLGWIDRSHIRRLPRQEWARQTIGSLVVAKSEHNTIDAGSDAQEAVRRMLREGTRTLFVTEGERLTGVLSLESLLSATR